MQVPVLAGDGGLPEQARGAGFRGFGHAKRDSAENARRGDLMGVGGRLDRGEEGRRFEERERESTRR